MQEKELNQKIDDALSSLDGIQKAEADAALFDHILRRLAEQSPTSAPKMIPMRTVWLAAASFAFMVMLNTASLYFKGQNKENNSFDTEGPHSAAAAAIAQVYLKPNQP